ncbi:uncharacterized protein LOC122048301 [Zingiber officinale]|uniref:uncharacterized protein LOC122048301 n=1 Tax=Zingiber officinale TaxID=94328 RepID=UPI001C4A9697|nr:uncharacterized protein LOC122048301 [Zingiber officinale]
MYSRQQIKHVTGFNQNKNQISQQLTPLRCLLLLSHFQEDQLLEIASRRYVLLENGGPDCGSLLNSDARFYSGVADLQHKRPKPVHTARWLIGEGWSESRRRAEGRRSVVKMGELKPPVVGDRLAPILWLMRHRSRSRRRKGIRVEARAQILSLAEDDSEEGRKKLGWQWHQGASVRR